MEQELARIPGAVWALLAALAIAAVFLVKAFIGAQDKIQEMLKSHAFSKTETDDRYVKKGDCDTCRVSRAEKGDVTRAERDAVHVARNELAVAIGNHVVTGHPETIKRLANIDTQLAVLTDRQTSMAEQQARAADTLDRHGQVLEEIRSLVRSA